MFENWGPKRWRFAHWAAATVLAFGALVFVTGVVFALMGGSWSAAGVMFYIGAMVSLGVGRIS